MAEYKCTTIKGVGRDKGHKTVDMGPAHDVSVQKVGAVKRTGPTYTTYALRQYPGKKGGK